MRIYWWHYTPGNRKLITCKLLLAKQLPGDGDELNVTRPFINPADLGVPVQLFHRTLLGDADAAEHLDGSGSYFLGDLRAEIFCHGRFGHERLSGIPQPGRVIDQEPRRFDIGCHPGKLKLYALELGDGLPELLALPGVADSVIQRASRQPDHLRPDGDAALIQ